MPNSARDVQQLNWDGRVRLPQSSSWALEASPGCPRYSGTCVVAGFGATLFDDLAALAAVRPDLPTIAVNAAAGHVKAFALYSQHFDREHLGKWVAAQCDAFGDDFTVHAPGKPEWLGHNTRNYRWVDHWWPNVMSKGSSGWGAVLLAKAMGFREVILCGVPIDTQRYANGQPAPWWQRNTKTVKNFRKAIELDKDSRIGTYSLSGWTRDLLGAPPGF